MVDQANYKDLMNYGSLMGIINNSDPFRMNPIESKNLRFQAIQAAFAHHYSNNSAYRPFCEGENINPNLIKTYDDVPLIPLVPSDFFRDVSAKGDDRYVLAIASVPPNLIARRFTTSGTGGKPSVYPYDGRTLNTINLTNIVIFRTIGGIKPEDYLLFLTRSPDKSDTGMVQGMYMTLAGLFNSPKDQIEFAILNDSLDLDFIKKKLNEAKSNYKVRHLYGPPYAFKQVTEELAKRNEKINLDNDSKAFTTGGWKKFTGESISPTDLRGLIQNFFGIQKGGVRDGLGLTDIMSILVECEHNHKHVPPWLDVSIRDLNDPSWTTTVPVGKEGLIAFVDPLLGSYPLGIVTGDVGKLTIGEGELCECGRYGPTLEYIRRAGDPRGCAQREESLMAHTQVVVNTKR